MAEVVLEETVQVQDKVEAGVSKSRLEEVDKLRLQNAFLTLHALKVHSGAIQSQFEVLRRDAAHTDEKIKEAQAKLEGVRDGIAQKYDVDLRKVTVDADGKFIPLDPKKVPFPVGGPNGGAG